MSDIVEHLLFAGRYGFETEEQAAARRIARNHEAADEIERLRAKVSEWQPIETAPKGGSRVLLASGGYVAIGAWDAWLRHPDGRVVGLEAHCNPAALVDCWRWDGEGFECNPPPTHWMPLPEAPK